MCKGGVWPVLLAAVLCGWAPLTGARGKRLELAKQPRYDVHRQEQLLPRDMQISAFLNKGIAKTYFYWSDMVDKPLSVTVTPCKSTVNWSVRFRHKNDTTPARSGEAKVGEYTTRDLRTLSMNSQRGLYVIQLEATESDSYAHVYVSTEAGGPQALQVSNLVPKMRFQDRQRKKKLTLRWNQSLVDPHVTEYCLVVSTKRNYSTLCEAMEHRFGVFPPDTNNLALPIRNLHRKNDTYIEPIINCVGDQTHHTFSDLKHGELYYFNLFATNLQSNLSYLYGSAELRFNSQLKPMTLKDGKATFVNLKKYDGKTVFRYKVGRGSKEPLRLYVMPCGGAVDVEVTLKGKSVLPRRRIDGYGKLVVKNPVRGQRYYIRVSASNREELKRTSVVEVLATTKQSFNFPLPIMPSEARVYEYDSLRKCNSVTVGWMAAPDRRSAHYCLVAREGKLRELEGYRIPNQCGLENRLRKSADFAVKYCQDFNLVKKDEVITQEITQLKAGKSYVVQVTVRSKKPRSKTLSYELLQVHTKPTCEH